jgi:DNA mismatch repair protein MutL
VNRVHLLEDTLANQIAAGEVIERPAAVLKELVENALDAGARRIEVELLEGGRRLLRVSDDGHGMSREDAALSVRRHATSKLRTKEDLFDIGTYGFRGEALPSIAAVSRFSLLTAEPGALAGTRIEIDGGRLVALEEAGAPPGTAVEVRDLFWNVPARRKFLRRDATEQAHSIEALLRLAIPRLDAGFVLREGARLLLRLAPGEALERRAEEALGREVRGRLFPFEAQVRGVRAHGLGASPDVAHGSAKAVWLFVNGRAIRDRSLLHAVLRAYSEVLPHGRYPAALVFLEVPRGEVDVNVHPAKAEVRLADARAAYEAIARALGAQLAPGGWLHLPPKEEEVPARTYRMQEAPGPQTASVEREHAGWPPGGEGARPEDRPAWDAGAPAEAWAGPEERARAEAAGLAGGSAGEERGFADGASAPGVPGAGEAAALEAPALEGVGPGQQTLLAPQPYFAGLRYLGQLHRTYLVCEGPRGLVLIDQHAAHERMNYQRLRRASLRGLASQPLLLPRVLQLPLASAALLDSAREALAASGIDVEEFGGGSVAVKALPALLSGLDDRRLGALLSDLCGELSSQGRPESLEKLRDALLARAGCHASVRAHDLLSPGEAQALLDALDATDYGARCAHGRPVVAEWGSAEIEKRFGRDYQSFRGSHE